MHRLTPAQHRYLAWTKAVTSSPGAVPVKHESHTDPRDTANVLLREGYLEAGTPNAHGNRTLTLTDKGQAAA